MKNLILFALLLVWSITSFSNPPKKLYPIVGPTSAYVNITECSYSFTDGATIPGANWTITGGTINYTSSDGGVNYYADVYWGTVGTQTIYIRDINGTVVSSLNVVVQAIPAPPTPSSTFTISNTCGSSSFTRNSSPGSGITWYWQTDPNGTSTTTSAATFTTSNTVPLYLRAQYNAAPAGWSTSSLSAGTTAPKPIPVLSTNPTTPVTLCNGTSPNIIVNSTVSNTIFTWTVAMSNATGATQNTTGVTGSSISLNETLLATSQSLNGTVTYTVSGSASGCSAGAVSPQITVKPLPSLTVTPSSPSICSGSSASITASSSGTITWSMSDSGVSPTSASGSGSALQALTTTGGSAGNANFIFTATSNGCQRVANQSITVYPIPIVTATSSPPLCSGSAPNITLSSSSGTTFNWVFSQVGAPVSGGSNGSGPVINQSLTNNNTTIANPVYTVTPTGLGSCQGPSLPVQITVNPAVNPFASAQNTTSCDNVAFTPITLSCSIAGTTYAWTATPDQYINNAIGGTGPTISGTLHNTSNSVAGHVTYLVTATANGCTGQTSPAVLINPTPIANPVNYTIFSGQTSNLTLTNTVGGGTFSYTVNSQSNLSGFSNGSANPIVSTINSTDGLTTGNAIFTITPSVNGCFGLPLPNNKITVYPVPVISPGIARFGPTVKSVTLSVQPLYDHYAWTLGGVATGADQNTLTTTVTGALGLVVTKNNVTSNSVSASVLGQLDGINMNYVVTNTPQVPLSLTSDVENGTPSQVQQNVKYFDGLGRHAQTVLTNWSPSQADLVQPVVYDAYGREYRKYLPFTSTTFPGLYKDNLFDANKNYVGTPLSFYNNTSDKVADEPTYYYNQTVYEPSPLNRPIKETGPGSDWFINNKSIVYGYQSNNPQPAPANPYSGFSAQYRAILDKATALGYPLPSWQIQIKQDQLVRDLLAIKHNFFTGDVDCMYVFNGDNAGSSFQTLNWISPSSFQGAFVGTIIRDPKLGILSDGTSYFNTNYPDNTRNDITSNAFLYHCSVSATGGYPKAACGIGWTGGGMLAIARNGELDAWSQSMPSNSSDWQGFYQADMHTVGETYNAQTYRNGIILRQMSLSLATSLNATKWSVCAWANGIDAETISNVSVFIRMKSDRTNASAIYNAYMNYYNSISPTPPAPSESIIAWTIGANNLPVRQTANGGYYLPSSLTVKSTKDEQGREVREYTDNEGHVVLKKVQALDNPAADDATLWAQTYYIYDIIGQLRSVLQPELVKSILQQGSTYNPTTTDISNLAFCYAYDSRLRMVTKKIPGADSVFMIYDNRDRLVLTQHGNLRATNQWAFTKYDALNRPISTGIYSPGARIGLVAMQGNVNNFYSNLTSSTAWYETFINTTAGNIHGYDNKSFPQVTDPLQYLTVNYYDSYLFRTSWLGSYTYVNEGLSQTLNSFQYNQATAENLNVAGLITGTKTKVLDGGIAGGYTWLKTVTYYDDKYRPIQTYSDNYKGGTDRQTSLYDFAGKVLLTKNYHEEYDVTWKDMVAVKQEGNKLIAVPGAPWVIGAASVQQLPAGQDGWVEFTYSENNVAKAIGLSDADTDAGLNSIDYAIEVYLTSGYVVENGVQRPASPGLVTGDVLRIERVGTSIMYKRNGTTYYTSTVPSTSLLMVDCSFSNNPISTLVGVRASFSKTNHTTLSTYDYDNSGRIVHIWHQLDTQPVVLLVKNEYNELGQLVDKKLHSSNQNGTDAKQSIDYRYNIRGWMTKVNESDIDVGTNDPSNAGEARDLFGMELGYTSDIGVGNQSLYNGDISGITWSKNQALGALKEDGYIYSYDPLNRITGATFKEKNLSWASAVSSGFSESNYTYDLNGNIKSLIRYDQRGSTTPLDYLLYNYSAGNQLLKVDDSGDKFAGFVDGYSANDYTYDANGNMTVDQNKGIVSAITYNYLNLPEVVSKGAINGDYVRYIYDATGRKLTQTVNFLNTPKQTDYAGDYIYENDVLQQINHEEGRIVMGGTTTLFADDGSMTTNYTASNSTISTLSQNNQTYIKVVSNGTVSRTGVFPIGNAISVTPGDRYKIRARIYRDKGTAASSSNAYILVQTNGLDLGWPGSLVPLSLTDESCVEEIVYIPIGATTMQVGVVWNTVLSGEAMYINGFEIDKLTVLSPDYQYNLKDHLGNVRTTFTANPIIEQKTATYEDVNAISEQGDFLRYANARRVVSYLFDHTNGSAPTVVNGYAERLSGGPNEIYGLARSLSVMPGDVVSAEVYGKYVDSNSANWTAALTNLMAQIGQAALNPTVVIDGGGYSSSTSSFPFPGMVNTSQSSGGPKAYLNWLIFDRNYVFLNGGFTRMTAQPQEHGQDVAHEHMLSPNITITQPGYVYFYLSNEESSPVEVYFDDFKVTQAKSPVVQTDDYYAFGLTFNSYKRENSVIQNYLYNGKELQTDLGLNWLDYGARMYAPEIGKFFTEDRYAEKYKDLSPYHYASNNPIKYIDQHGDSLIKVVINDESGHINGASSVLIDHTIFEDVKSIFDAAVETSTPIYINSSFRTNKKQEDVAADPNSTTPAAAGTSAHNAGLALDFNVYKDNDKAKGLESGNTSLTSTNAFIKKVTDMGWRYGGDFTPADKVHIDKKGTDDSFKAIRDANQTQVDGSNKTTVDDSKIKRTENITVKKKEDAQQ